MSKKQKIAIELATLKQQLRERERESKVMNRFLLVVNTILTSANL